MKKILIGVCLLSTLLSAKPKISWDNVTPYDYEGSTQIKTRKVKLIGIDSKSKTLFNLTFDSEIYHLFFSDNEIRIKTYRGRLIGFIDISKVKFLKVVGE